MIPMANVHDHAPPTYGPFLFGPDPSFHALRERLGFRRDLCLGAWALHLQELARHNPSFL
eukprot:5665599-Lingulodinium_polyedra.AAC.1